MNSLGDLKWLLDSREDLEIFMPSSNPFPMSLSLPSACLSSLRLVNPTSRTIRALTWITAFLLIVFLTQASAQDSTVETPSAETIEHWYKLSLNGGPCGYSVRSKTHVDLEGRKAIETTEDTHMIFKRMDQSVTIQSTLTIWEDAETTEYIKARMVFNSSNDPMITEVFARGETASRKIHSKNRNSEEAIPWDKKILGPSGIKQLMENSSLEPGSKISYLTYSFETDEIGVEWIEVVGREELDLGLGPWPALHIKTWSESTEYLVLDQWVGNDNRILKSRTLHPSMKFGSEICSKQAALANADAEPGEIFLRLSPASNVLLLDPYHSEESLLRIRPIDKNFEIQSFSDQRQTEEKVDESGTRYLRIRSQIPTIEQQGQRPLNEVPAGLEEYLQPSPILQSDDPKIIAAATQWVAEEPSAWKAAKRLEEFVFHHIAKKSYGVGFASAREVLDSGEGDCSEHAVLLAALCRAVGIPSRIAVGLVYFEGCFGGHMWTEVWIENSWYSLDATMGLGSASALHLAMDKAALSSSGVNKSFNKVNQALGNVDIDILEIKTPTSHFIFEDGRAPYEVEGNRYTNPVLGVSFEKLDIWSFSALDPSGLVPIVAILNTDEDPSFRVEVKLHTKSGGADLNHIVKSAERGITPWLDIPSKIASSKGRILAGKRSKLSPAQDGHDGENIVIVLLDRQQAVYSIHVQGNQPGDKLLKIAYEFVGTFRFPDPDEPSTNAIGR